VHVSMCAGRCSFFFNRVDLRGAGRGRRDGRRGWAGAGNASASVVEPAAGGLVPIPLGCSSQRPALVQVVGWHRRVGRTRDGSALSLRTRGATG
jgi:hypothetical protein